MDLKEFKNIFIPFRQRFYRIAYALLQSDDEAKDAVQDLYLRLWINRDSIGPDYNHYAYALTALKSICIDRIRKHNDVERIDDETDAVSYWQPDVEMMSRERLRTIMNLIEKLPEKQRLVVRHRILESMEYPDISRLMGLSEGNLRTLLSLARDRIRKQLDNERL